MATSGTPGNGLPESGTTGDSNDQSQGPGSTAESQQQPAQPLQVQNNVREIQVEPTKRIPNDLINHLMVKEFTVEPLSPADFVLKHSSAAVNLAVLFGRFNDICGDFDEVFDDPNKGRLCIGFCSDIIFDVGPASRKSKSGDKDKSWCFTFNISENVQRYAYVATFRKNQVGTQGLAEGSAIYLTIKQASLIAVEVLSRLVTCVMKGNKTIDSVVLTPLAGAIFSRNDMSSMAYLLGLDLDVMVNLVNRSCQSGSQYFPKGKVSAEIAVVAAATSTRNMKNEDNRLAFVVRTLRQFTSNHHPFDPELVPKIVLFANCGLPHGMSPQQLLELCTKKDDALLNMKDLLADLDNQAMTTLKNSNLPGSGTPGLGGGNSGLGGGTLGLGGRRGGGGSAFSRLPVRNPLEIRQKLVPKNLQPLDAYEGLPRLRSEYYDFNNAQDEALRLAMWNTWRQQAAEDAARQRALQKDGNRPVTMPPVNPSTRQPVPDHEKPNAEIPPNTVASWADEAAKQTSSNESVAYVAHEGNTIAVSKMTKKVVSGMEKVMSSVGSESPDYGDALPSTEEDDEVASLVGTVHTHSTGDTRQSDYENGRFYRIPTSYLTEDYPRYRIACERRKFTKTYKILESEEYLRFCEKQAIIEAIDKMSSNMRESGKLFLFRAGFSGDNNVHTELALGNLNIPGKWRAELGISKEDLKTIYANISKTLSGASSPTYAGVASRSPKH